MRSSFAPKDAGTSRWDGGPATITNPRFEYRKVDFGRGEEQIICLHLDYATPDGATHEARFDVGNKQTSQGADLVVIRESADDGADEAEVGPSFSHISPDAQYKVSPRSEFYAFTSALVGCGAISESKLGDGDIGVIDGLDVIVAPKARKEGDRFPLLLPVDVQGGKKPAAKTATAKAAAKPAVKKPEPEPEEAEAEEEQELDPQTQAAFDFVVELDKPVKVAKAVSLASSSIKDKKIAAAVIKLVQQAAFHERFPGFWSYDAKTKTIKEA